MASGHPRPEHSTSTWRRSSWASGQRIRLATSPPSTRKTICPRKDTRRAGRHAVPIERRAHRFGENARTRPGPPAYRGQPPRWGHRHHLSWREFVALYSWLARLAGQKRDKRAQHFAGASEPLARDLDDGMRPTGFTQMVEHNSGLSAPAHEGRPIVDPFRGRTRAPTPAPGWTLAGRDVIKSRVVR